MDALAQPIVPPAPKVHPRDLSLPRLLWGMSRSTIGVWPKSAFDDLIITGRRLGMDSILVNDPEGVRHVLGANVGNYARPIAFRRIIRPVTGSGLLLSEGAQWRRHRRMLAPAFTPASIGSLLPHFQAAGETMVRELGAAPTANLSRAFHDAALDAVLRALFSLPISRERASFAGMVRRYVAGPSRPTVFDGIAKAEDDFPFVTGGRRRFARDRAVAVGALVEERRRSGASGRSDVLDLLIAARDPETGEALTDAEIADQTATLLFAGFETTSRLLFWAAYLLSLDGFEQAKLRREVLAFPPDKVGRLNDLQQRPRLRNVLLEALRLYPPAPNMVRDSIDADVICGTPIAPKTQVWISPWVMHRHNKLWDRPTAFLPDRFAGQASPWTSNGAYLPFGAGPHICIGSNFAMAEAQIILATLLSRFEISLVSDRPVVPTATLTVAPDREPMFALAPVA